jgi:hypothetical protein
MAYSLKLAAVFALCFRLSAVFVFALGFLLTALGRIWLVACSLKLYSLSHCLSVFIIKLAH